MTKRKNPIAVKTVCELGTLAYNRAFSERDFREYTGQPPAKLRALVARGVIRKVGRGSYYPTPRGWNVIERACKLRRK